VQPLHHIWLDLRPGERRAPTTPERPAAGDIQMDSEEQDSIDPSANAHDRWSSKFGNHRTIVM
jgi:hypothetical protein